MIWPLATAQHSINWLHGFDTLPDVLITLRILLSFLISCIFVCQGQKQHAAGGSLGQTCSSELLREKHLLSGGHQYKEAQWPDLYSTAMAKDRMSTSLEGTKT